ncbi:MAG: hypothetical protein ITG02_01505 [Patulibacter sp.]|nr:hypothetical protein [Patulibacter sp.]
MPTSPVRSLSARHIALRWLVGGVIASGLLTGCGQSDDEPQGARILVTTDQGTTSVLDRSDVQVEEGEPVLAALQRAADVTLGADGTIESIDGAAASGDRDWAFWVNGVEIRNGGLKAGQDINLQQRPIVETPQTAQIHDGDTVWFDLRSDPDVGSPRGVVGTFPEPFLHGFEGQRWPVRVECAEPRSTECRAVRDVLVDYGIPAVSNRLRTSYNPESTRISVGLWTDVREDPAAQLAERGPQASGIYAVPTANGREIALLDAAGKTVETAGPGTGLIFASRYRDETPSWAVTGTDMAGLRAAIEAWNADVLSRHYAVVVRGQQVTGLPVAPRPGR